MQPLSSQNLYVVPGTRLQLPKKKSSVGNKSSFAAYNSTTTGGHNHHHNEFSSHQNSGSRSEIATQRARGRIASKPRVCTPACPTDGAALACCQPLSPRGPPERSAPLTRPRVRCSSGPDAEQQPLHVVESQRRRAFVSQNDRRCPAVPQCAAKL